MSFSAEVKMNLSQLKNLSNKDVVKYELIGYLISNNTSYKKGKLTFKTENEYNINRFSKLLLNMGIVDYKIEIKGKNYIITLPAIDHLGEIDYLDNAVIYIEDRDREEFLKAILRGAFLGAGSINNPEKKHHLEIILSTKSNMRKLYRILKSFSIQSKTLRRRKGYSIYMKDGEGISSFLALIGASSGVLKFEEIRVLKDMKNSVNRKVNYETANLNKTINAAVKQINAIKELKKKGKFKNLPDNLKEIAELRLDNPDASLQELGQMLETPIGKSGVNHRLNKILEYAEGKEK